jgi:purine-binding chemotaxis protein CheW
MSPQKRKKLEAAIDNLFSSPKLKDNQAPINASAIAQPEIALTDSPVPDDFTPQANITDLPAPDLQAEPAPIPEPGPAAVISVPSPAPIQVPSIVPSPSIQPELTPSKPAPTIPVAQQNQPAFANGEGNGETVQLVIFTLDGQYYGIGIEAVDSIIKMQAITELPHAPYFIIGLTNLRGKVVPVVSLRRRFGLAEEKSSKNSRIIVINVDQKEAGIIVDEVSEVETIPRRNIEPAPMMAGSGGSRPIDGIAKLDDRLIILLNLLKVIAPGG